VTSSFLFGTAFTDVANADAEKPSSVEKNNGSTMVIVQGIGQEVGHGIGLQTPRWWNFLSMRMSLLSTLVPNQANNYYHWTDFGVDFQLAHRVHEGSAFRPYMIVGFAKMLGTPAGIERSDLGITSWGYRFGIESKFEVHPFWGDETHTSIFFLEAGPQVSSLQRFDKLKAGDGFLVKVGFGRVF
jgi:hypothetical protein